MRLDNSAPAVANSFVGMYFTVNGETHVIVSYSVTREVVFDSNFNSTLSACTATNITLCTYSSMWTITTGTVYDVRVESNAAAIWLPFGGCTARTVSGIQTCVDSPGSLMLRGVAKIEAGMLFRISFAIDNPPHNQEGQVAAVSVSGIIPFAEQRAMGNALLTDTAPSFLLLNISDTSKVLGAVNNMTLVFLTNVDLVWPASITLSGLSNTQTATTGKFLISGPNADLFGYLGQWDQLAGSLILSLSRTSAIMSGANNPNLTIQNPGSGYVDGDLITAEDENCSGFSGAVKTDGAGSIIQVILYSAGFCNFADPAFVIVYSGTRTQIEHTIPMVNAFTFWFLILFLLKSCILCAG